MKNNTDWRVVHTYRPGCDNMPKDIRDVVSRLTEFIAVRKQKNLSTGKERYTVEVKLKDKE